MKNEAKLHRHAALAVRWGCVRLGDGRTYDHSGNAWLHGSNTPGIDQRSGVEDDPLGALMGAIPVPSKTLVAFRRGGVEADLSGGQDDIKHPAVKSLGRVFLPTPHDPEFLRVLFQRRAQVLQAPVLPVVSLAAERAATVAAPVNFGSCRALLSTEKIEGDGANWAERFQACVQRLGRLAVRAFVDRVDVHQSASV